MRFRTLFIAVFSLVSFTSSYSQGLEKTIDLGNRHFESGQIAEALYTYQRAVFYSSSVTNAKLLLKIAECFQSLGDFDNSIEYFDHAYYSESSDIIKTEILFKKANAFIQTGNYHFALIEMLGISAKPGSILDRRRSLYLASAYYGLEDFDNAESYFIKSIPPDDQASAVMIHSIFNKKGNFLRPNPKTAMWLSVFLPGTGQFYSGDWSAGINSFLLTGFFVGLTFYLTQLYHPIDAILTALPWFQRYYQGGFGQAERIAENKRNRKRDITYQNILDIVGASNSNEK